MDENDSLRDTKVIETSMYVIVVSSIDKLVIKVKLHTESIFRIICIWKAFKFHVIRQTLHNTIQCNHHDIAQNETELSDYNYTHRVSLVISIWHQKLVLRHYTSIAWSFIQNKLQKNTKLLASLD